MADLPERTIKRQYKPVPDVSRKDDNVDAYMAILAVSSNFVFPSVSRQPKNTANTVSDKIELHSNSYLLEGAKSARRNGCH